MRFRKRRTVEENEQRGGERERGWKGKRSVSKIKGQRGKST